MTYAARPSEKDMMCLAKFAVNYEVVYSNGKQNNVDDNAGLGESDDDLFEDDINHDGILNKNKAKQEVIKLKNNLGYMRKRKRESVLRTYRVKLTSDPEKYYHSLLMLIHAYSKHMRSIM